MLFFINLFIYNNLYLYITVSWYSGDTTFHPCVPDASSVVIHKPVDNLWITVEIFHANLCIKRISPVN